VSYPSTSFPNDVSGVLSTALYQGRVYALADFAPDIFSSPTPVHQKSQWSPGASAIEPINLQRPPNENWSITAYAVTITLALVQWQDLRSGVLDPPYPTFGKLGQIITGLVTRNTVNTVGPYGGGSQQPYQPIPTDATLTETVFDPAADALPPANLIIENDIRHYSLPHRTLLTTYCPSRWT
jgi:hypothetical protein